MRFFDDFGKARLVDKLVIDKYYLISKKEAEDAFRQMLGNIERAFSFVVIKRIPEGWLCAAYKNMVEVSK